MTGALNTSPTGFDTPGKLAIAPVAKTLTSKEEVEHNHMDEMGHPSLTVRLRFLKVVVDS